jgi:hypothetical protein
MSNDNSAKALSVIGGLIGCAVVLGIIIYRDETSRAEAKSQINSFLKTTRKILGRYDRFASLIKSRDYTRKIDNENSTIRQADGLQVDQEYENIWKSVENSLNNNLNKRAP